MLNKLSKRFITAKKGKFAAFDFEDPLNFKTLLTEQELEIMQVARDFFQENFFPGIIQANRTHSFDKGVYKKMGEMGFLGCTLKDYGGSGVSSVSYGLINREIERVDSAYRSVLSVQNSLAIFPIHAYAQKAVKDKYLPGLMAGEIIGAFGLTEPDHGSDPGSMKTKAVKDSNGNWILNGSKNWITSSPIADVFVVWAKDDQGIIKGFVLDRSMEGITTPVIEGKLSLAASITGMIMLEDVKVPASNVLEVDGLKGPFSCLNNARFGISWGVLGAAEFCFHFTRNYTLERKQFGVPLASFQLIQKKFADMATDITLATLSCIQLSRLKDNQQLAPEMISMIKRNNCMKSLQIARECRDILGGNGIVDEYHVMRHMVNLETVNTYEGTNDVHALILGRAITGIQSFTRNM